MPRARAAAPGGRGPQIGEIGPDFNLRHTFDHIVRLSDALKVGPVLLAFYVFDFGFV